ncbi:hypothetical protein E2H98_10955 [Permianibacter aggregans]|uniref:hypothetical protein n=1 Tax=Permianibacter aggregans TaxID=1510150 RepID=UPI00105C859D|nr:hypothetical protein [Permianibacter aggregans]QGX40160.1 hypothetical protein E2H98_10955 [Permianibacter aggregans]
MGQISMQIVEFSGSVLGANQQLDIWRSAKAAFCDMTDGIEQGLAELESVEKLEDADRFHLNELFVQICHDLLPNEA